MRTNGRMGCGTGLVVLLGAGLAWAAPADTTADIVLGQGDFTSSLPAANASGLQEPRGLTVDPVSGRLFVADTSHNRVLSWPSAAALTNGDPADIVLGQADFTSVLENETGVATPTARSMSGPRSVALDPEGRLYVADSGNKRVLRFDPPFSTHMEAVQVFGQGGDFTKADQASQAAPDAQGLGNPDGIAVDSFGNLYVADRFLHRVTIYLSPTTTDTDADLVIGQPSLTVSGFNQGGSPAANTLAQPIAVGLDADGNLYVCDEGNNRVLLFLTPLTTNMNASRVYGQPDFTSDTSNNGGVSAVSMFGPVGAAVDPISGNLFVADAINNRVLEFVDPLNDSTADRVYGQGGDFTTNTPNKGGVSADSLNDMAGVAVDALGHLYVSDRLNNRVLRFDALPVADVFVTNVDTPDPVTVGEQLVYSVTVANNGPGDALATEASLSLPAGVSLVSVLPSVGSCSGDPAVTCVLGDLPSGGQAVITVAVTPSVEGVIAMTATAGTASSDPDAANNTAVAETTVTAASNGGGGDDGDGQPQPSGPRPLFSCGGPTGLAGAGGAGLLPAALLGLGTLKRGARRRLV